MTFKNTTPTHKDQNLLIKAVVGGSAADIIKAMQQSRTIGKAISIDSTSDLIEIMVVLPPPFFIPLIGIRRNQDNQRI